VLPNRYLFQLAEAPPPDLPALLQIFPSVPPVMKRKAIELLQEIRDTVKRCLGPTIPPVQDPVVEVAGTAVEAPVLATRDDSVLWSGPSSLPSVAHSSALFGPRTTPHGGYATTRSSLFGSPSSSKVSLLDSRFHAQLMGSPSLCELMVPTKSSLTK
jgi:exosome complex exonuclease RRP6